MKDVAIVTDIPGTTRDVLKEQISLDGVVLQLVDTAGLRESTDVVEKEGIRRALQEIKTADHLVFVVDGTTTTETNPHILFPECIKDLPKHVSLLVLYNKIDCLNLKAKRLEYPGYTVIFTSVKTGEGLCLLQEELRQMTGLATTPENVFMARRRHVEALIRVKECLKLGEEQLSKFKAGELLAEELRQAQLALDEVTGKFTTDDLLGKIFSEFCVGK